MINMTSIHQIPKKRRVHSLKEIALRQAQAREPITQNEKGSPQTAQRKTAKLIPENHNQQPTLALETPPPEKVEIEELANQIPTNDHIQGEKQPENQPSMAPLSQFIQKELKQLASILNLAEWELTAWLSTEPLVPTRIQLQLLRMAIAHQLDPIKGDIGFIFYDDTQTWQVHISLDGYCGLLNRHPAFDGIEFREAKECIDGIPKWIECTIHRKDRSRPTIIREYFEEVKQEDSFWIKMPRRMLRFKALQQCARIAINE